MSARNTRAAKVQRRNARTVNKAYARTLYEVEGMFIGWVCLLHGVCRRPSRRNRRAA